MRLDELFTHSTPQFQQWFAGSKLVTPDGQPLKLYHGTSKDQDFKKFRMPGNGIWFTTSPKDASDYAMNNDSQGYSYDGPTNMAHRVMPVYVRALNPLIIDRFPEAVTMAGSNGRGGDPTRAYRKAQKDWIAQVRQDGHDAIVIGDTVVVIGSPNQIKSAVGNKRFDPSNANVTEGRCVTA